MRNVARHEIHHERLRHTRTSKKFSLFLKFDLLLFRSVSRLSHLVLFFRASMEFPWHMKKWERVQRDASDEKRNGIIMGQTLNTMNNYDWSLSCVVSQRVASHRIAQKFYRSASKCLDVGKCSKMAPWRLVKAALPSHRQVFTTDSCSDRVHHETSSVGLHFGSSFMPLFVACRVHSFFIILSQKKYTLNQRNSKMECVVSEWVERN